MQGVFVDVGLPKYPHAIGQKNGNSQKLPHSGYLSEEPAPIFDAVVLQFVGSLRNVHNFKQNIQIVEQVVQEVAGSGRYERKKCKLIDLVSTLQKGLNSLVLEERFEEPKKRSGVVQLLCEKSWLGKKAFGRTWCQ